MRYFFTLFLISGMAYSLSAQDLDSHQWQDRVLLLLTDDLQNREYIRQTNALLHQIEELQDRKIVVYTLFNNRFAEGLPAGPWAEGVQKRFEVVDSETGFRLVLLGLDGGVKLEEPSYVPVEKLWVLIDGMPMRRAELRNNGNR